MPASSSSRPTEGWKPQSEEHLRILELLGIAHGVVALTKVDLVDADHLELVQLDLADRVAGTFLGDALRSWASAAPLGVGVDELRAALDRLVATHARGRRPRPAPAVGRPRVRGARERARS